MSNKKIIKHYNMDKIDSENANFNLIYGERSNGKSYQVKHKKAVEHYFLTHRRFILLRRLREEISSSLIEQYFQDVDIEKISNGKYQTITLYKNKLWLANFDTEDLKIKRSGEYIGYVFALSTEQNYAGGSFLDVDNIIFEEFMSRSVYLRNEPDKLMNLYCTVDRKRQVVRVWLVGNTITRVCPYIDEWGLSGLLRHQKQGSIVTKEFNKVQENGENVHIKIACEYCQSTGTSSFTLGKHSNMLDNGSWQVDPQPHLPKSKKNYEVRYRIGFQYSSFRFLAEFLIDKKTKESVWFIYPYEKEFKKKIFIFSDCIRPSPYWQRDIYNVNIYQNLELSRRLKRLFDTFCETNIFYANDLCGTDFKQVIDFTIRK